MRRKRSRRLGSVLGSRWSREHAIAVAFLLAAVALLGFDVSDSFMKRYSLGTSYRFASTELALPNFLAHFGQMQSLDKVIRLSDIKREPGIAWGGPSTDLDWRSRTSTGRSRGLVPRSAEAASPDEEAVASTGRSRIGSITSGFGFRRLGGHYAHHDGIDIAAPHGATIRAAWPGTVTFSGWRNGYGKAVIIDHGNGKETLYAHASDLAVSEGQVVVAGQSIGRVGSTGRSFGPHVHFELRYNGVAVDPEGAYLASLKPSTP